MNNMASILEGKREIRRFNGHETVVIVPGDPIDSKEAAKKVRGLLSDVISKEDAVKKLKEERCLESC